MADIDWAAPLQKRYLMLRCRGEIREVRVVGERSQLDKFETLAAEALKAHLGVRSDCELVGQWEGPVGADDAIGTHVYPWKFKPRLKDKVPAG